MLPVLLVVGFLSVLGQVALLRELVVAFYGSELIYLLGIALWMIGTGAGAILGRGAAPPGPTGSTVALAALGVALPGAALLARAVRLLFRAVPGAYMPFAHQLFAMALVLLPPAVLLGFLFVRAARGRVARGGSFASAYGIESLGGVLGGLASILLLAAPLPSLAIVLLAGGIALYAAALPARRAPSALALAAAGTAIFALCFAAGDELDRVTLGWQFPDLLESSDSPYGRFTFTGRGGQVVLYENGALSAESESTDPEELVHLALLQHEAPTKLLVLGGGFSGTLAEALEHPVESIDYVELDEDLVELARARLPGRFGRSLLDPKVKLHLADGRRYVRNAGRRFDAILVDMPPPASGGTNRFYTAEFFAECRAALRPGGLIAFRLPSAEQAWTALLTLRNASIYRALVSVFSDAIVLPGSVNLFIASDRLLSRDPAVGIARYRERKIDGRLVSPGYIDYLYTNDRFGEIAATLATTDAPVNSDLKPICYPVTVLLWLARFHRSLAGAPLPGAGWAWAALPPLFLLFLRARRHERLPRLLLVALAGFAGVTVEFAVLLRFQTASGIVYRDLGLLFAGFMAGLALGPIPGRAAAKAPRGGALLALALAVLCGAVSVAFASRWEGMGTTAVAVAALALAGAGVGAVYCGAAERWTPGAPALYAADLVGGSAGAVIGALFLIPLLGLPLSALWTALLLALALPLA